VDHQHLAGLRHGQIVAWTQGFGAKIDALYEARVRLICSAADTPEMLYLEGEGTFEFERTASRLREMQGVDWTA
ncbi:MAG: AFG1/ZapE family ATPase, partial [Pseudomonadota bacterium]